MYSYLTYPPRYSRTHLRFFEMTSSSTSAHGAANAVASRRPNNAPNVKVESWNVLESDIKIFCIIIKRKCVRTSDPYLSFVRQMPLPPRAALLRAVPLHAGKSVPEKTTHRCLIRWKLCSRNFSSSRATRSARKILFPIPYLSSFSLFFLYQCGVITLLFEVCW